MIEILDKNQNTVMLREYEDRYPQYMVTLDFQTVLRSTALNIFKTSSIGFSVIEETLEWHKASQKMPLSVVGIDRVLYCVPFNHLAT